MRGPLLCRGALHRPGPEERRSSASRNGARRVPAGLYRVRFGSHRASESSVTKEGFMNRWKATLAAVASCTLIGGAWAQAYPTRTIKLAVPFSAGGSTDISARLTAEQMRKEMGQTVIVENGGGAAGALGAMRVPAASPATSTLPAAPATTLCGSGATP